MVKKEAMPPGSGGGGEGKALCEGVLVASFSVEVRILPLQQTLFKSGFGGKAPTHVFGSGLFNSL